MPPPASNPADAMYSIKTWPAMRTPPHHTKLCEQCQEISESGRGSSKSYTLFSDKRPWEPDCYGCWIFEGVTKATAKSRKLEVESVSLDVQNERRFRLIFRSDQDWDEYWIYNGLDSPYSVEVLAYPEPGLDIIDEESAVSYARDRLSSCAYLHEQTCALPYSDPDLPTRVVCVGNDNDSVFLIAQSPESYHPSTGRYACLSHCWGDSQPLRTLKENLKAHLENIPWQQIPKTFQDAISFTRALGVHYIWIDSLCIVQDDADDWLAESAKMADIYQNGYLTVAASAGRGSRDGLYHPPGNTNITFGEIHDFPVGVGLRRATKHPVYRGGSARSLDANADFPLFTRAWVFQERMLSARVVHFGPHEMFWECRKEGICACNRHRIPMLSDSDLLENQALSSKSGLTEAMNRATTDQRAALWRDLVEEYSQLRLTKSSDKLPAIEGLAAVMRQMRWDEYVAGMWTETPLDLLWTAKTERDFTKQDTPISTFPRASYRTLRWRAPSWSWASVDADIIWTLSSKAGPGTFEEESSLNHVFFSAEYMLDGLDQRIKQSLQSNLHGRHSKPTLKLTGQVEPGTLFIDVPGRGADTWLHIKSKLGEQVWSGLPTYSEDDWEDKYGGGYNYIQLDDPEDLVKLRRGSAKMKVMVMRMAAFPRKRRFGHQTSEVFEYCLILIETTPGRKEYRRVGVAIRVVGWSGFRLSSDPWDYRRPSWEEPSEEEEVAPKETLLVV